MTVLKITIKQSNFINKLIKANCANYFKGNCLLLDGACLQLSSKTSILCNYFKRAILPIENNLYETIINQNKGKRCILCNSYFKPKANNQRYCEECAIIQKRLKARLRKRKQRSLNSSSKAN